MPTTCVYSTLDLPTLWGIALASGCVLLLESLGLLWRKYIAKQPGWTPLLLTSLVLMVMAFVLTFAVSGHTVSCGHNPTGQEISIETALLFQYLIIGVLVVGCVLVLLGLGPILRLFSPARRQ